MQEWEAKAEYLGNQAALQVGRDSMAGFYEEYRGRKECRYVVSEAKFTEISKVIDLILEHMAREKDWKNLGKTIYFTQAFSTEYKGKIRTSAQKYVMSTMLKEPELWSQILADFLNVSSL